MKPRASAASRLSAAPPQRLARPVDGHWVLPVRLDLADHGRARAGRRSAHASWSTIRASPPTSSGCAAGSSDSTDHPGSFVAERDLAEIYATSTEASVTVGPVYDISQIVQDDYVLEREGADRRRPTKWTGLPTHPIVPRLSGNARRSALTPRPRSASTTNPASSAGDADYEAQCACRA